MLNPGIFYMLACSLLFAVAVVVHFHCVHLSLPISTFITVLTVILPIAAFLNAYIYPNLLRSSHSFTAGDIASRLAPVVLQGFQAIATAVLATLLFAGVVPTPALDFLIDYGWEKLFQDKDGISIELIQNSFDCCGLNSVDDRSYPFFGIPGGSCAEIYGRTKGCRAPWQSAMQATSGIDFGVVLAVGLMQIVGLLIMRERTAWWTALRTEDWKPNESDDESARHLFTVPEESEGSEQDDAAPRSYGSIRGNVLDPSYTVSQSETQRQRAANDK